MLTVFDGQYFVFITVNRFCNQKVKLVKLQLDRTNSNSGFSNFTLFGTEKKKKHLISICLLVIYYALIRTTVFFFSLENSYLTAGLSCGLTWVSSWVPADLRC